MKITIIGAGAIGLLLASSLEKKNEISVLVKKEHYNELIEKGLWIEKKVERKRIEAKIITEMDNPEIVIIAVKGYDLGLVSEILKDFKGKIIICQNGLKMLDYKTPNNNELFAIVTSIGAVSLERGLSKFMGTGRTVIGNLYQQEKGKMEKLFSNEYFDMCDVENIRGEIWLKAAINSAINPVAAFHNINNGKLKNKRYWIIVREILEESVKIAVSKGIKLPQNPLEATEKIIENTPENLCSMLQDLRKGRRTEINEINGLIVKIAKEKNLSARLNLKYLKKIKSTS